MVMIFPDVTVIGLSKLGTVSRYLQLNVTALDAKPIFLSNGKLLLLLVLLFIFVSKLFIVRFQMGTVWKEFYSSLLLLFWKILVSIFLVLGGVLDLRDSGTSRAASDLVWNWTPLLLKEINAICVITDW